MIATHFARPHLPIEVKERRPHGSRLPAQQARRRLDEYGTRTLVVGALGVIGRSVVEHLADSGRSVVGPSRRRPPLAARTGAEHVLADVTDPGTGVCLRDAL